MKMETSKKSKNNSSCDEKEQQQQQGTGFNTPFASLTRTIGIQAESALSSKRWKLSSLIKWGRLALILLLSGVFILALIHNLFAPPEKDIQHSELSKLLEILKSQTAAKFQFIKDEQQPSYVSDQWDLQNGTNN